MARIGVPPLGVQQRALSSSSEAVDVAIVGAGHNGLIAALLLARQGLKVSSCLHPGHLLLRKQPLNTQQPCHYTSTGGYIQ